MWTKRGLALTGSSRALGIPSDPLASERTGSKASADSGVLIGRPWALPCFSTTRKTTRASFIMDPLKFDGRTDGFTAFHSKAPRRVCKGRAYQRSVWTTSFQTSRKLKMQCILSDSGGKPSLKLTSKRSKDQRTIPLHNELNLLVYANFNYYISF